LTFSVFELYFYHHPGRRSGPPARRAAVRSAAPEQPVYGAVIKGSETAVEYARAQENVSVLTAPIGNEFNAFSNAD
jgi:hypothetical protein